VVRQKLAVLKPEFFSVTFGAGGTTQERTFEAVFEIQREGHQAAPHLSCIGSTREHIREILQRYQAAGIRRIVALRGDLPSGVGFRRAPLRQRAGRVHPRRDRRSLPDRSRRLPRIPPQARAPRDDLLAFKRKVDAGADSAITQYFYNLDAYLHFRDECAALGITIPIVPGIMPIVSFSKLARFSDACGAEIPRWMRRKFEAYGDDTDSIKAFGLDVVSELCAKLLAAGAPGSTSTA
jgi:methylenetetrahydrofolate reductase (NADPH)